MYEDQTFDAILERLLGRAPDNVDKREGSIIYDALAPAAVELAQVYIELNTIKKRLSVEDAADHDLTEICYQNGVFRKGATKAIRKAVFNIAVPLNSRFSSEKNTYKVLENITGFEYKLECEQIGEEGNVYMGPIFPIDFIDGLNTASLTDVIVPGVKEETDEQLRERYRQGLINPSQDGNVAQYLEWAQSYNGIGIAKVFPLWDGANTVKIAITDRLYQVADSTLVNAFQQHLDPDSKGLGNGVAPIGAKVTVTGGIKKDINITGNIVLAQGYSEPEGVADVVSSYLSSITYKKNSVSYMRTGGAILDSPSIVELNNFTLNGGTSDLVLVGEENPHLNSINLTVVVA